MMVGVIRSPSAMVHPGHEMKDGTTRHLRGRAVQVIQST
jgi:hypothetical protein